MHAPERPSDSFLRPFESKHCFGSNELIWDGLQLRLRTVDGPVMATVEEDAKWAGMWRVRFGGKLSDVANLSRAKDAAISLVLSELNKSDQVGPGNKRRTSGPAGSHANKPPQRD